MFKTFIADFSAGYYDTAIIAALIVVGLIQSIALRRKWWQANDLKQKNVKIATAATKALFEMMTGSFKALVQADRKYRAEKARADAAEAEITAIMQAAADEDDAADEAALRENNPFTGRPDIETLIFGDSHFGVGDHATFASRHPARNSEHDLAELFSLLDGKGRNGKALDDLIFGRNNSPNVRVIDGGDLLHGRVRGAEGVNVGDVLAAITGDPSALEQKVGAKCIGLKVMRQDGSEITGPELDNVIASLGGRRPHPSFDGDLDPAAFGTQVHENIERSLNERGAHGTVESMTGPDESCSTQEPRSYPASSPRAG